MGRHVPAGSSRVLAHFSQTLEASAHTAYPASMTSRTLPEQPSAARTSSSPASGTAAASQVPFAERRAALCAELALLLQRRTGADGGHETGIPALALWRFSHPTELTPGLQQPAVYVVV